MKLNSLFFLPLLFVALLLSVFLNTQNASAVSEYDDTITTVQTIKVANPNAPVSPIDLTGIAYMPALQIINGNYEGEYYPGLTLLATANTEARSRIASSEQQVIFQDCWNDGLNCSYSIFTSDSFGTAVFQTKSYPGIGLAKGLKLNGTWTNTGCQLQITGSVYCSTQIHYGDLELSMTWDSKPPTQRSNDLYYSNNFNIIYPEGYEGKDVNNFDPAVKQSLKPDFAYTVSKTGELNIQYLKNISPFLTGIFYTNIDALGIDWNPPVSTIESISSAPAGWMNETYQLPSEGYYMLNISHNQQFDSPPWDTSKNWKVEQVFMQFYWDGKTALSDSNVGCSHTEMCNSVLSDKIKAQQILSSLNVPLYGLQLAVLAPLDFLTQLSQGQACSPLVLPLPNMGNITIPCMLSVYQTHFNQILVIYQTVLVALFSYYVAIRALATIKGISNPRDDQIETVQL